MPLPHPPPGFVAQEPHDGVGRQIAFLLIVIPPAVLILSLFAGFGWGLIGGAVAVMFFGVLLKDSLHAALGWNGPIIEVSNVAYALGSTPTITYRRKPKRVMDISSCQVTCRLVCEESATYTRGSTTTTDTREVYETTITAQGTGTADGLVATIPLDISAHRGAPSFALMHNKVKWFAKIEVVGPRLPKDDHTFLIKVAPRLDERHRAKVQDT